MYPNLYCIHKTFQDEAKQKYGNKKQNFSDDEFWNNFAQVSVYFKSLNTKFIEEEPKYTVSIG